MEPTYTEEEFESSMKVLRDLQRLFRSHKNNKLAAHIIAIQADRFTTIVFDKMLCLMHLNDRHLDEEICAADDERYDKMNDLCLEIADETSKYLDNSILVKEAKEILMPLLSTINSIREVPLTDAASLKQSTRLEEEEEIKVQLEHAHETYEAAEKYVISRIELSILTTIVELLDATLTIKEKEIDK